MPYPFKYAEPAKLGPAIEEAKKVAGVSQAAIEAAEAKLNEALAQTGDDTVVNLASNEYFSSVKKRELDATIVSPVFKDWKNGKYKIISFYAKRARGAMAHYLLKNRVEDLDGLCAFDADGYRLDEESSTPAEPVFLRRQD